MNYAQVHEKTPKMPKLRGVVSQLKALVISSQANPYISDPKQLTPHL